MGAFDFSLQLDLKSVGQNLQKLISDTDEFEASKANALMMERRKLEQEHIVYHVWNSTIWLT